MSNTLKKLGDAELEIMQIIWNSNAAVTSNQILKELQERRRWQLSESKNFLQKLYNNSIQNMVATLYNNRELKNTDMAELRKFLDDMEDQYSAEEVQSTEEKL